MKKIKVIVGELIKIETNCRIFKQFVDGVELIVEGYPELRLGANKENDKYTITELNSGMMVFTCSESKNYLQLIINKIDSILEVVKTEQYIKQVEKFKILPSEEKWIEMWKELETILELKDFKKICESKVFYNILVLELLEQEIYLKNREVSQSRDKFFNGKSCKKYILDNYGERAIELVETLSRY